jgi:hypothetical protein
MRGDLSSVFAGDPLDSSEITSTTRIVVTTPWGLLGGSEVSEMATYLLSSYQTANTVYLDSTNGSDTTGTRGYPNKPYASLAKAASVAQTGDTIIWYPGAYTISSSDISTYGQPNIKSGQTWLCLGPTLTQTTSATKIFTSGGSGDLRSDFSFLGNLKIKGNGYSDAGGWASVAFDLNNCSRFSIEGVSIGAGISETDGNTTGYTGTGMLLRSSSLGRITGLSTNYCMTGLQVDGGAEYNTFSDCVWNNASDGVIVGGGNNRFSNCSIIESYMGLVLEAGSNHGHGTWVGGCINHCTVYAVNVKSVTNGFTFDNVHFYGDSTTTNVIRLSACQRVHFQGGTLASPVTLAGTLPGKNLLHGMDVIPASTALVDPDTQIGQLIIADCYSASGAWTSF